MMADVDVLKLETLAVRESLRRVYVADWWEEGSVLDMMRCAEDNLWRLEGVTHADI